MAASQWAEITSIMENFTRHSWLSTYNKINCIMYEWRISLLLASLPAVLGHLPVPRICEIPILVTVFCRQFTVSFHTSSRRTVPFIYREILICVMLYVENINKTSYWNGWRHVDKQFHAVCISEISGKATFYITAASTSENEDHLICVFWRSLKGQGWLCSSFFILSPSPQNQVELIVKFTLRPFSCQ
jgi:hypothetical protein